MFVDNAFCVMQPILPWFSDSLFSIINSLINYVCEKIDGGNIFGVLLSLQQIGFLGPDKSHIRVYANISATLMPQS